jgi:NADPH2:quinone reductase
MKAIQFARFGGAEVLQYVDIDRPVPKADQILIEVSASAVNFPDIRERSGVYQRAETRVGGVALPHVTGLQAVGRVVQTGADADSSLLGRKVVALLPDKGGYAQYVAAPQAMAVSLPEEADDNLIASLPAQGVTAYLSLNASTQLKPGETVLVHGAAGGVGSIAIQIAKLLGAGLVIGTASTPEKRAFARNLGADVAIDYEQPDWTQSVLAATNSRGVDVILESIGGDIFEQNFDCLATFGRYVVFGSTRGPGKPFEPRRLMTRSQTIAGLYLPVYYQKPELIREALTFLVGHTLDGLLKAPMSTVMPLSETARAHRMLEERQVTGVIVLDPAR